MVVSVWDGVVSVEEGRGGGQCMGRCGQCRGGRGVVS